MQNLSVVDRIVDRFDAALPIYEDVYEQLIGMLEPHVIRQGKPDGTLPASVVESMRILLDRHADAPHPDQAVQSGDGVPEALKDARHHLKNWLEQDLCECEYGCNCGRAQVAKTVEDIEAMLTATTSQPADPWIKCSEHAPEFDEAGNAWICRWNELLAFYEIKLMAHEDIYPIRKIAIGYEDAFWQPTGLKRPTNPPAEGED